MTAHTAAALKPKISMPVSRNVFLNPPARLFLAGLLGFLLPLSTAFRWRVLVTRLRLALGFAGMDSRGLEPAVLSIADFFCFARSCIAVDSGISLELFNRSEAAPAND